MSAGLNAALTKQTVDVTCGGAAQALNVAFLNIGNAKKFLDTAQNADLILLGYTQPDIDNLKSAMADLDQLRTVFLGQAEVSPAKDFTAFARRIWGTGYTGLAHNHRRITMAAAKLWKLITTRECARILSLVVTAPSKDRDLHESAKAMEVDGFLARANLIYDGNLEELIGEAKRVNRRFAGRADEPEYQMLMTRINARVQELDESMGQEETEYLLESRLFLYAKDTFLDLKGAPADRILGPKYQKLRHDLEAAKQVEVEEIRGLHSVAG